MKKFLNVFLIVMVVLSLFTTITFATESVEGEFSEEGFELTEEQLQQLLQGSGYEQEMEEPQYYKAKVIDAGETVSEADEGIIVQTGKVEIQEGDKKGQVFDAKAVLGYIGYEDETAQQFLKGESVYVTFVEELSEDGSTTVEIPYIVEINRTSAYITLAIVIVAILIGIALLRGIEILGLIVYNALIITLGILFMYFEGVNEILSLITIVALLIVGDTLILNKFKKDTIVILLSSIISVIIGFGLLTVVNLLFKLEGFVGYFDITALVMIIPAIGITIDVVRRTIKKAKEGKNFKCTLKDVFEKLPSKYNMVLLVWAAFFVENAISMQSYLSTEYPFGLMNFGTIALEISRLAIMIVTPIISISSKVTFASSRACFITILMFSI